MKNSGSLTGRARSAGPSQQVVADEHGQERERVADVRERVDLDRAARKATESEQTTLKNIARSGTPCLLTFWKKRGNCPSTDIWCNERAQPMIAFNADSASATISIIAINQLRALAPAAEDRLAKVTKIVFGSTSAGSAAPRARR